MLLYYGAPSSAYKDKTIGIDFSNKLFLFRRITRESGCKKRKEKKSVRVVFILTFSRWLTAGD